MESEGRLSRKQTFKIPELTSAYGTKRTFTYGDILTYRLLFIAFNRDIRRNSIWVMKPNFQAGACVARFDTKHNQTCLARTIATVGTAKLEAAAHLKLQYQRLLQVLRFYLGKPQRTRIQPIAETSSRECFAQDVGRSCGGLIRVFQARWFYL